MPLRDRDVRNDVKDRLDATDLFDGVFVTGLPEDFGRGAGLLKLACVEPDRGSADHQVDDAPDGLLVVQGNAVVTVLARDDDPQARDETAELLLDAVCDAVNGQSLAGLTYPALTAVLQWTWKPARCWVAGVEALRPPPRNRRRSGL